MPFNVLEEDAASAGLDDDAPDMRPEVAWIGFTASAAGRAEGLAGIARQHDIHSSAPRAAVEGCKVIPYRRVAKGLVGHPRHENRRSEGVPLDVTHSPEAGFCKPHAEVQASDAGTQGKASQEARRVNLGR